MHVPGEIWDLAISYLADDDLLHCAQVNKDFYTSAVRLLYRDVCLDTAWRVGLGRQAALTPIMDRSPTRVRSVGGFLKTIKDNEFLRRLVKSATFLMLGEASRTAVMGPVKEIFEQFSKLDCPPFIHLSCPLRQYWSFLAPYASIRSLRLKVSVHFECPPVHYATFREVMQLSSLRHLTIADLKWLRQGLGEQDGMARIALDSTAPFSDLETLAILQSSFPSTDLEKIVAWPKGLKSFAFEVDNRREGIHPHPYDAQLFGRGLGFQAATLEQVHIEKVQWDFETESVCSLAHLTNVKRIGLPLSFLTEFKWLPAEDETCPPRGKMFPDLHSSLPPSVEALQIQVPPLVEGDVYISYGFSLEHRNMYSHALYQYLHDFIPQRQKACPRLAVVALYWQPEADNKKSIHTEEVRTLQEAYRQAGISLTVGPAKTGPLFGFGRNFTPAPGPAARDLMF